MATEWLQTIHGRPPDWLAKRIAPPRRRNCVLDHFRPLAPPMLPELTQDAPTRFHLVSR